MWNIKSDRFVTIILGLSMIVGACESDDRNELANLPITIDWVPSAEYIGFFVARDRNFYKEAGFNVTINYGSGAPNVTLQLAGNAIQVGTTTSDNIIRSIEAGGEFRAAFPILNYNPASLIVRGHATSIATAVSGGPVGVNVQSAVYNQFQFLLAQHKIAADAVEYYPIGFGGVQEFLTGQVDGFLGYTTNHGVELQIRNAEFDEILFEDLGIHSMGLVLLVATNSSDFDDRQLKNLHNATMLGYQWAFANPDQAAEILLNYEPSLKTEKLVAAFQRMRAMNSTESPSVVYDDWLLAEDISRSSLEHFQKLLTAIR